MNPIHILVFTAFALLFGWAVPSRWRGWVLLGSSVIAIYWLQPSTPLRNFDFWFPTASIALTIFVWVVTREADANSGRKTLIAALVVTGIVLLLGITRYIDFLCCLTPSRPPDLSRIALIVGLIAGAAAIPYFFLPRSRFLPAFTILFILSLFIILKTDSLARSASAVLRTTTGQSAELASAFDLPWLGFSFLAFRLLSVLRDYQSGKLPSYSLSEFVTYAIFFPTYIAGPIDRSQRFIGDLRKVEAAQVLNEPNSRASNRFVGSQRILIGAFKKFVLADSLALFALNAQNALQVESTIWTWVLLYAYALRIYFDFAGYTDIAIGLGNLLGFKLPENFNRPYLKLSMTAFWNSWHITLAQWFRAYYFNPLTRSLRSKQLKLPSWVIIFIGQFTTMLLIGLWHGITLNFAIWGAWHGIGLFINNRWSNWIRPRIAGRELSPGLEKTMKFGSWLLTFNFVSLGWVWFALPDPNMALNVFKSLFGI